MPPTSSFSLRSTAREPLRPPWRRRGGPPIVRLATSDREIDPATVPADAEELAIHAPELRTFGPGLPCATVLRSLVLDTLHLAHLELPPLPQLRRLRVSSHDLTALPALDRCAPKLTDLCVIYAAGLERLPDPLPSTLRSLHVRAGLTTLSLAGLVELRSLVLERTRLDGLPALPEGLEFLRIEGGAISDPEALAPISRCRALRDLALVGTTLDTLPASLGQLRSLLGLDLTGSPIVNLPDALADCASLQVVLLTDNAAIETLPDVLFRLPALREVDLTRTRVPPSEWAGLERASKGRTIVFTTATPSGG